MIFVRKIYVFITNNKIIFSSQVGGQLKQTKYPFNVKFSPLQDGNFHFDLDPHSEGQISRSNLKIANISKTRTLTPKFSCAIGKSMSNYTRSRSVRKLTSFSDR